MNGQVVRMSGTSVRRGGAHLLRGVEWSVNEDERWAIIGPNGAGKTTLLRIAAAQMFPTTGTVELLDERLGAVDVFELRPRIGFASAAVANRISDASTSLDLVISASYGYLGSFSERYAAPDYERARALLGEWGVAHLAERAYGTLSEGERKRVLVARALMADPELLLLDEPAAGLDLGGREDLVRRLGALARSVDSPVLVIVSHHVEEIPPGFTHVLMMSEGGVVVAGPVGEVMTADNLTATFGLSLKVEFDGERWSARAV